MLGFTTPNQRLLKWVPLTCSLDIQITSGAITVCQYINLNLCYSGMYRYLLPKVAAQTARVAIHNHKIYVGTHNYRIVKVSILALTIPHFPGVTAKLLNPKRNTALLRVRFRKLKLHALNVALTV